MKSKVILLVAVLMIVGTVSAQSGSSTKFSLATAATSSKTTGTPQPPVAPMERPNSTGSARLYSILVPGGGQFYNGETGKGLMFLGAAVLGYTLFATNIPSTAFNYDRDYYYASYGYWYNKGNATLCYGGLALALGATVWSVIDAPKGARRHNERLGLASLSLGDKTLWVNLEHKISSGRPGTGLRIGLSF